jgi:SRSO17 transposase
MQEVAMSKKRSSSRRTNKRPASGRKPSSGLALGDIDAISDELKTYHRLFHTVFQRREQRYWSLVYLCGQLSDLERKTIEPMVLALLGPEPNAVRAVEHFISQGAWETRALIQRYQEVVAEWLGDPLGVVIIDGSGFPKQGHDSAGVAHQYCGALGKVANCQEGVFAVYVSPRGYAFVDMRLYVHEDWFDEAYRERWKKCGIPADLPFRTESQLALDMVRELVTRGQMPFQWVTFDEHFGESPSLLDEIDVLGKWYMAEVPSNTRVWLRTPRVEPPGPGLLGRPRTRPRLAKNAPRARELRDVAASLPQSAWTRYTFKEGSKGPMVAEFVFLRVTAVRDKLPGPRVWAVFRRSLEPQPELKFYLSNAPCTCAHYELAQVCGLRWPVETTLEEGKGEVGLDHYETRTWLGWHHHMAHTFLAHLFLMRLRLVFKKNARADHGPSTPVGRACYPRRVGTSFRHSCPHCLPSTTKLRGLSFASQTDTTPLQTAFSRPETLKSRSNAKSRSNTRWSIRSSTARL